MQIISIPFGSAGSSWFLHRVTQPNGKLYGHRWNPSYRASDPNDGDWGLAQVIEAPASTFKRTPTCPKPYLPSRMIVDELDARLAEQKANAARLVKLAKSYTVGTKVTYQRKSWNSGGEIITDCYATVVGHQGRRLVVDQEGYDYNPVTFDVDRYNLKRA